MSTIVALNTYDPSDVDLDGFSVEDGSISVDGERVAGYVIDEYEAYGRAGGEPTTYGAYDPYESDPLLRESYRDPYWERLITGYE